MIEMYMFGEQEHVIRNEWLFWNFCFGFYVWLLSGDFMEKYIASQEKNVGQISVTIFHDLNTRSGS